MLGVFVLEPVLYGLEHVDALVRPVHPQVELGACGPLLHPPEPVEGGHRANALGDVAAGLRPGPRLGEPVAERDAVLEHLKLQRHRIDFRDDLEVDHRVAFSRQRLLDERQARQERVAQPLRGLAVDVGEAERVRGEVSRQRLELRQPRQREPQLQVIRRRHPHSLPGIGRSCRLRA